MMKIHKTQLYVFFSVLNEDEEAYRCVGYATIKELQALMNQEKEDFIEVNTKGKIPKR